MGNYNPHAPYILGQEWVPIRQANYKPDKITEQGYSFRIDHSVIPITGAYYVAEVPQTKVNNVADMIAVYASGDEDLTGPIQQVNIPASAIWVTGAAINASAGVAALQNPSDDRTIRFTGPTDGNTFLGVSFDVTSYAAQLSGKRILDVSFRYSIAAHDINDMADIGSNVGFAKDMFGFAFAINFFALQGTVTGEPTTINSFSLGATNYLWDATRDPYTVHDVYPWRYEELARFAATEPAFSRMLLKFNNSISASNNAFFNFVDMQVTYCDERRILYGGRSTTSSQDPMGTVTQSNYEPGPNLVRLFNTSFVSNSTALAAGDYVVTLTHDDWPIDGIIGAPNVSAIRELYQVGPQRGIRVNKSLIPDETFTAEDVSTLTELTLHTTAAVVTGSHPYGTQDDVPVYGLVTARQEIEDDPVGTSKSYPQVRFYARRFGDTTQPLVLGNGFTSAAGLDIPSGVGNSASTPDNAALDITGDIDIRADVALDNWNTGTQQTLVAKWSGAIANLAYRLAINTTGMIELTWQIGPATSTFASGASSIAPTPNPITGRLAVRATLDVNNGAGGSTITFYTAPTIDGPWAQLGVPAFAGVTTIASTSATMFVGANTFDTSEFAAGMHFAAQVRNGIDGTVVANPNFGAQAPGTLVFADSAGRTWTVNGSAAIVASSTTLTNSVSITPAELDALPEIVDGWREVNLRFTSAPTFATAAGDVDWYWSSASELAKNQWQVLGAGSAPFIAHSIGPASYYAPQGNTVTLTWKNVNDVVPEDDTLSDAVLLFATDPPSISGFAISTESQSITGIAEGCVPNSCIPSAIQYNEVSWTALGSASPLVTGGSIELQRSDDLSDWETIMLTEDLTTALYRDFEARVGLLSSYRIRTLNALDFAGAWVTGSGTIPAPGVTIGGSNSDGNSVLIFTSNENPDANLAYVMQWEGQAIETFAFPEADEVQLQRMFGKDFFTAFHPLERGGDQFTRTILVNAAAIPAPSMANFHGLRDLAWASLNYVCVRDELGNRWFANILVPEGTVRMNRTKYLAQIEVSEVTDTPTPIAEVP